MPINTLEEKFAHELGDVYDAEHQFLEALQQMQQQSSDSRLQGLLQTHMRETQQQIGNLEQVFSALGMQAQRVTCDGAAGIVSEGRKAMSEASSNRAVLDCVIASSAAKAEHYEISSYRDLVKGAELMGHQNVLQLLHQNLQQEEQTAQLVENNTPALLQKAMQTGSMPS